MTNNYITIELMENICQYISLKKLIEREMEDCDEQQLLRLEEMLCEHRYEVAFKVFAKRFPILNKARKEDILLVITQDDGKKVYTRLTLTRFLYEGENICLVFKNKKDYLDYRVYYEESLNGELNFYHAVNLLSERVAPKIVSIEEIIVN